LQSASRAKNLLEHALPAIEYTRSATTEYLLPGGRHGVAMYPCWEEYYGREWHEETHERKWREREVKGVYRALPSKDVARRVRGSGSSRRGSG